jgi:hypothetical protein
MTHGACSIIGILFSTIAMALALPAATSAPDDLASFTAFLPRFEQGISDFINGDPTLWKQNVS